MNRKNIAKGLCSRCKARPPVAGITVCVPCRQARISAATKDHAKFKRIIYDHYGAKCKCCGETEIIFLTIDHVNNDGNVQRKQDITGGTNFYRQTAKKILLGEPPTDLQILCRNCNWGKHVNHGICPHVTKYIEG